MHRDVDRGRGATDLRSLPYTDDHTCPACGGPIIVSHGGGRAPWPSLVCGFFCGEPVRRTLAELLILERELSGSST